MYIPLSELSAALPANQIHHSAPPPLPPPQGGLPPHLQSWQKKPEMLMYNMYIPLSELSAALPANQIHHSDPPPLPPLRGDCHHTSKVGKKNLKCSCTTCTFRFQNFPPPCLQTKSIILTHPLCPPSGRIATAPPKLAKKPEMLMYNMYIPLSELSAALPANQIHHSDPPPLPPPSGGIATAPPKLAKKT